ncbi:ATP-binding protein [Pseudonocardia alni]|uniref:ATP-binding protein n=1 Tax=Pseudonocardia alni TaxID=33907 RepID=UPI0027A5B1E6|nr:AAA family ATPase [Pseudonocardia alni]
MLMTHIPMDHLVALAEQRQARLREEADRYRTERLARGAAGPSPVGRLWLRLRARLTAARRPGPAGPPSPDRHRTGHPTRRAPRRGRDRAGPGGTGRAGPGRAACLSRADGPVPPSRPGVSVARATMRSMTAGATHGDGATGPDPDELVGRADELAGLLRDLDAARAGRARAVLLAGEAGIGKSRLATALGRAAAGAGAQVVVGRCLDAGGAALPYLPFSEVLDALARAGTALRPVLHGLLPGAAEAPRPAAGDGDSGRLQVFDAVAGAVRDAAATAPLLVVLEDLHWADRSTRELLAFLLARLGSQRLLVLGTYRSDDLHRRHPLRASLAELVRLPAVRRVELGPLTPDAVLALVRARAATGGVDEATLHRIAARREGNAFYAEELVAAGSDGLPGGLADVLLTRLDRLGGPAREVLRVASLAERSIPHDLLRDAAELSAADLEAGLREAVSHHLLVPDPAPGAESYAFRHALLREAVHDDLLPAERVRLHARLTALLAGRADDPGVAAALARHALAAHDLPRALAASVRAAEEAHRRHGPAEMLAHAERALELWSAVEDPERLTGVSESALTREAAWAASASGDPERGIALGARAVRVADLGEDPHARAETRRHYAMRLLDSGARVDAAVAAATEAVELLAGARPARSRPGRTPCSRGRTSTPTTPSPPGRTPARRWRWPVPSTTPHRPRRGRPRTATSARSARTR